MLPGRSTNSIEGEALPADGFHVFRQQWIAAGQGESQHVEPTAFQQCEGLAFGQLHQVGRREHIHLRFGEPILVAGGEIGAGARVVVIGDLESRATGLVEQRDELVADEFIEFVGMNGLLDAGVAIEPG